jgi:hypothetical protein
MRYLKRLGLLLILTVIILNLSGCETLKKKFSRKPKAGKKVSPVLVPQDYKGIYPNSVLYDNHFIYWRTGTEDLMNCLQNKLSNKRQVLAASRAVEDLERMQDLLNSPKKEALEPHIKVYERVLGKVRLGRPNDALADSMWHDLENQRRLIIREFEPTAVKAFILREEEPIKPLQTIEQTLPDKKAEESK